MYTHAVFHASAEPLISFGYTSAIMEMLVDAMHAVPIPDIPRKRYSICMFCESVHNNNDTIAITAPATNTLRLPIMSANLAAGTMVATDDMKNMLAIHPS